MPSPLKQRIELIRKAIELAHPYGLRRLLLVLWICLAEVLFLTAPALGLAITPLAALSVDAVWTTRRTGSGYGVEFDGVARDWARHIDSEKD